MNEAEKFVLEYYDGDQIKEVPIHLKFLTPALRVQIIQYDTASQIAFKKYEQETLDKEAFKRQTEMQEKINKRVEEIIKKNPNLTEAEIELEKTKLVLELLKNISEEDLKEREETSLKTWAHNDEWNIKFFKLIVATNALSAEHKKLILSEPDSNFWKNVNISKIVDINRFFRRTYSV